MWGAGFLNSESALTFQMFDVICLGLLIPLSMKNVPFPFARKLSVVSFMILAVARFCAKPVILTFASMLGFTTFTPILPLNLVTILFSVNAGIAEESFIVCVTNLVPMLIANVIKSQPNRVTVCAGGIVAVVVWASSHALTTGYNLPSVVALIIEGMVGFVLVYWKGNYGPLMVGHSAWDFVAMTDIVHLLLRFFA